MKLLLISLMLLVLVSCNESEDDKILVYNYDREQLDNCLRYYRNLKLTDSIQWEILECMER